MGARPLRRAIQRYIEDPLADFVLRAELTPGATVMVHRAPDGEDPEVKLSVVEPKIPAAVGGGAPEESTDSESHDEPAPPPPAADAEPS
jgi:ATP-dependent Clp protease ATP-binding subunit ClpC